MRLAVFLTLLNFVLVMRVICHETSTGAHPGTNGSPFSATKQTAYHCTTGCGATHDLRLSVVPRAMALLLVLSLPV